jgi:hypothetical protein
MTTLPHFRMSISSSGPAAPATQAELSQVLDFGAMSRPARGSFEHDQESAGYDLSWGSLAEFNVWRQEQKRADAIDLCLTNTTVGVQHFSWRRIYRCSRQGSGGIKPYDKKYPDRSRKIGPKYIGCRCKVDVKAYPGTNVLLGRYLRTHSHPIGMGNIVHTRLSETTKGKVKALLQQEVQRSAIVRDLRHMNAARLTLPSSGLFAIPYLTAIVISILRWMM